MSSPPQAPTPGGGAPVVVTYGPTKWGKSADLHYAAPDADVLVPSKGNFEFWSELTGVRPREVEVSTYAQVIAYLNAVKAKQRPRPSTIILDDLSILAERTQLALDPGGNGGWTMWGSLKRGLLKIRDLCIELGIPLFVNAHELHPSTDDEGTFYMGGPKLPSKAMTVDFPHIAHLVLRVGKRVADPLDWPSIYLCDPDNRQWVTGDRYVVCAKENPMNIREILRRAAEVRPEGARPIVPPRPKGLEWLDAAAEIVAQGMKAGALPRQAAEGLTAAAQAGKLPSRDPRHLRWAWRDGCARWELRTKGRRAELFGAFNPMAAGPQAPMGPPVPHAAEGPTNGSTDHPQVVQPPGPEALNPASGAPSIPT